MADAIPYSETKWAQEAQKGRSGRKGLFGRRTVATPNANRNLGPQFHETPPSQQPRQSSSGIDRNEPWHYTSDPGRAAAGVDRYEPWHYTSDPDRAAVNTYEPWR
jgi:hypothetical protein